MEIPRTGPFWILFIKWVTKLNNNNKNNYHFNLINYSLLTALPSNLVPQSLGGYDCNFLAYSLVCMKIKCETSIVFLYYYTRGFLYRFGSHSTLKYNKYQSIWSAKICKIKRLEMDYRWFPMSSDSPFWSNVVQVWKKPRLPTHPQLPASFNFEI